MATTKALLFLGSVFLFCSLIGASRGHGTRRSLLPIPNRGPAIFDVTKFGAVADDKTDNIDAFRAAWGEACKNSTTHAKVLIPAGTFRAAQTMFAGPCTSPKPITVEVMGTVKANTDPSEYVSPEWFTFQDIDGFVLTGKGVFDGQGAASWPFNDCKQTKGNCAPLPSKSYFCINMVCMTSNEVYKCMTPSTSVWKISNIHFRNIKGTTVSNVAVSLECSTRNPCEGVEITDVDLTYAGRLLINTTFASSCFNAKAIFGGILNPPPC
uniref:Exopolygalacturonase clone GBGE184 family n=1 Tax=Cajanus cajan TaxID=3821 RepID=A0A151U4K7_CAJCA|nr:Exopolygalacturonase clone GBGE184 family [Cajanus cajan]